MSISPDDIDVRISLASIRMSQQRFGEAKEVAMRLYEEIDEKEPCTSSLCTRLGLLTHMTDVLVDPTMPPLPSRLILVRLLLEHSLHLEAVSLLTTAREEDSLEVESAYLEGWAYYLRGEAIEQDASLLKPTTGDEEEDGPETVTAVECFAEGMRALIECGRLFAEQDYPDEGIGAHVQELLSVLQGRGVVPAIEEDEAGDGEGAADWEDVEMA
jgi:hypothetical protein